MADTNIQVSKEARECPLCGGSAQAWKQATAFAGASNLERWPRKVGEWFVSCDSCGLETKGYTKEAEAIKAWNTRSDQSALAEREAWEEALTPSGDTKVAYMGEFSFTMEDTDDEWGLPVQRRIDVPWTTIKEIMAAIRKRAIRERQP